MKNFKGFGDWIEIFRGGKQMDSSGREHDGDALIDRAVETFDPAYHEPPIVVGHPKDNAPAFGWVQGIKRSGNRLMVKARDVVPEFEAIAKQGLYKKRSASFYPDGRLRHVGFLGAAPPAVKGLADLRFDDDESVIFEFSASKEDKAAQEARSKKYKIAIKDGGHVTKPGEWASVPDDQFLDPVNYRYPCPDANQTRAAASYWGQADNQAQYTSQERSIINERLDKFRKKFKIGEYRREGKMKFSEFLEIFKFWKKVEENPDIELPALSAKQKPGAGGDKTFTEADIEAAKKEAADAEREKVTAEFNQKGEQAQREAQNQEISDFCDDMVSKTKIPPSWKDAGLVAFMQSLDGTLEITFAEGSEKKTPLKWFKEFLEGFGESSIFKEMATKEKAGQAAEFAEAKKDQETGESIAAKVN